MTSINDNRFFCRQYFYPLIIKQTRLQDAIGWCPRSYCAEGFGDGATPADDFSGRVSNRIETGSTDQE
jgi:hypothetical protein